VIFDTSKQPENEVGFGAYLRIRFDDDANLVSLHITGADEADATKGFISYFSPLACALKDHKAGDVLSVDLPSGRRTVNIESVSYCAPQKSDFQMRTPHLSLNTTQPVRDHSVSISSKRETLPADNTSISDNLSIPDENRNSEKFQTKQEYKDDANEIFPIVNERGNIVGRATRWQCHDGSKLLHPVVHLHLFNSKGELYLQKRPSWKDIQPDKWDTSVGGHIAFGETVDAALKREAKEELGIEYFTPILLKRYIFDSSREKELVNTFKTIYDGEIVPSEELDGGRFWSMDEIKANLDKKVFTPNFESEFKSCIESISKDKCGRSRI